MDLDGFETIIFCDGACSGNPGPGGWAYLLYRPLEGYISEASGYSPKSSNNIMEMTAALRALQATLQQGDSKTLILSDSSYLVQGIEKWIHGWKKRSWVKSDGSPVLNRELWEEIDKTRNRLSQVQWQHVKGHGNVFGNERVDQLAVAACKKEKTPHHNGSIDNYPLRDLFLESLSSESNAKYPRYLALVDQKLQNFETWPECEKFVKGKKAKFKKVKNSLEEFQLLKKWNLKSK